MIHFVSVKASVSLLLNMSINRYVCVCVFVCVREIYVCVCLSMPVCTCALTFAGAKCTTSFLTQRACINTHLCTTPNNPRRIQRLDLNTLGTTGHHRIWVSAYVRKKTMAGTDPVRFSMTRTLLLRNRPVIYMHSGTLPPVFI